ncbi:spermatogenesis-associated protein 1 isoform X1 [Monodelphis domestica]|uniref:spermatogenesis-associated protein 1 isoform X1 n=1 Tax=Monodelphis domestica TaxID=13616 RepID=UPI0004431895|nr:spermatogenesis-associated protein 1 isoform X1 [Monodelphis domestica]
MTTSFNRSRPSSSELVELHVFYVPEGSWNYKLNTISVEVVSKFISAGFIRVSPHLTLQALREQLGEFLGEEAVAEKFLFLKCIGNNLAVVKTKQEKELKLKSFAPPYALQPELYLLPIVDHLGNIYSSSSSSAMGDTQQNNTDVFENDKTTQKPDSCAASSNKEHEKDPSPIENTDKVPPLKNQEEGQKNNEEEPVGSHDDLSLANIETGNSSAISKVCIKMNPDKIWEECDSVVTWNKVKDQAQRHSAHILLRRKVSLKDNKIKKYPARKYGFLEAIDDKRLFLAQNKKSQFQWENGDKITDTSRRKEDGLGDEDFDKPPGPSAPPSLPLLAFAPGMLENSGLQNEKPEMEPLPWRQILYSHKESNSQGLKIMQQMKQVKEERCQLEETREELLKRVKSLFEQSKMKRYRVQEAWKKKYFETKKITASLEEVLTKLQEDLELYYKKLLMQLEAREIKMRPKNLANMEDSKNNLIIQITEVQHAIDQLKRKLDTDKMKLMIEIKMRKQAISDIRTLKMELEQKKMKTPLSS